MRIHAMIPNIRNRESNHCQLTIKHQTEKDITCFDTFCTCTHHSQIPSCSQSLGYPFTVLHTSIPAERVQISHRPGLYSLAQHFIPRAAVLSFSCSMLMIASFSDDWGKLYQIIIMYTYVYCQEIMPWFKMATSGDLTLERYGEGQTQHREESTKKQQKHFTWKTWSQWEWIHALNIPKYCNDTWTLWAIETCDLCRSVPCNYWGPPVWHLHLVH